MDGRIRRIHKQSFRPSIPSFCLSILDAPLCHFLCCRTECFFFHQQNALKSRAMIQFGRHHDTSDRKKLSCYRRKHIPRVRWIICLARSGPLWYESKNNSADDYYWSHNMTCNIVQTFISLMRHNHIGIRQGSGWNKFPQSKSSHLSLFLYI